MKKNIFLILLISSMLNACTLFYSTSTSSNKRPPIAPDTAHVNNMPQKMSVAADSIFKQESNNIVVTTSKIVADRPMSVIDSKGNIVIDTAILPDYVSKNLKAIRQKVRSFTPDQAKNLTYRYKMIPPRVLFVPQSLQKKGQTGTYFLYKIPENTLWYWKKRDGFFYLDENHYQ